MKKTLIKIIAIITLLLMFCTPAFAVAPLVLTAAELLLPTLIISGVSMIMPSAATSNVPKMGRADNYGITRNVLAKVGPTAAIAVAGFLAYNELRNSIGDPTTASGQQYPELSKSLYKQGAGQLSRDSKAGDVVTVPGQGLKQIISVYESSAGCSGGTCPMTEQNSYGPSNACILHSPIDVNGAQRYSRQTNFFYDPAINVPYAPNTDTEASIALQSPSLDALYPQVLPDLDKFIRDNPNKLQLPANLNEQVEAAKKANNAAQQQAATDTVNASNQATLDAAKNARDKAKAAYDADPSSEKEQILKESELKLKQAEKDKAADDIKQLEKQASDSDTPKPPTPPEYDKLNFQPLVDLGEELGEKFPFSLLKTLKNFGAGLVTTPRAPEFSVYFPAPFNFEWKVSLSRFDNIATMVRTLIAMAFLAVVTMSLLRRWH